MKSKSLWLVGLGLQAICRKLEYIFKIIKYSIDIP